MRRRSDARHWRLYGMTEPPMPPGDQMEHTWDEFEVFTGASALAADAREGYLRERCPTPALYTKLKRRLERSDRMPMEFLDALPTVPDESAELPEQIDQYEIHAKLGGGGMGVVYRGYDRVLQRAVAIKVLARNVAFDADVRRNVVGEAKMLASLRHPGIVEIYHLGKFRGEQYIAMQYVHGGTLQDWMKQKFGSADKSAGVPRDRKQLEEVLQVLWEIADALEHAHKAGVVHCDVKPSNIVMTEGGRPLLTDFGISQRTDDKEGVMPRGGTPPYAAPESLDLDRLPDRRWDVYSLGMLMYEMLTGGIPEVGGERKSEGTTVSKEAGERRAVKLPPLRGRCAQVSAKVEQVCRAAITTDPELRYRTAGLLATDLRACVNGDPLVISNSVERRVRTFVRKHRRELAATMLVVLCFGLLVLEVARRAARECALNVTTTSTKLVLSLSPSGEPKTKLHAEARPGMAARFVVEPGMYRLVAIGEDGHFAESTVFVPREGWRATTDIPEPRWGKPDENEMAFIPSGVHRLGEEGMVSINRPRDVLLDSYYIDRAEVSNGEYLVFCTAMSRALPPHLTAAAIEENEELAARPIVGITLAEAAEYAAWVGKRLPTADEWEAAMRYPDGRRVPWGNAEPAGLPQPMHDEVRRGQLALASGDTNKQLAEYLRGTEGVRSRPEFMTASELYHGATNVNEMTSSLMPGTSQFVIKGASWLGSARMTGVTVGATKPFWSGQQALPTSSMDTGFRCARSAEP